MRWSRGERSQNLDDRRGQSGGGASSGGGGGGGGLPMALIGRLLKSRFGIVILLLGGALYMFGGKGLLARFGVGGGGPTTQLAGGSATPSEHVTTPQEEELVDFISFVLDDAQKVWHTKLSQNGDSYREAKLVLFTDAVNTACGAADSGIGPFYCPGDEMVYIDLSFYRQLRDRFGAPGDFAQAYVLAHEIGHHLQTVLGYSPRMRQAQKRNPDKKNELSILLELQADCFAGVWANSTAKRELLERGDVQEGLKAAAAVGDDSIQKQATGRVNPETWTHGSSAQRQKWFLRGLDEGTVAACDTFKDAGVSI